MPDTAHEMSSLGRSGQFLDQIGRREIRPTDQDLEATEITDKRREVEARDGLHHGTESGHLKVQAGHPGMGVLTEVIRQEQLNNDLTVGAFSNQGFKLGSGLRWDAPKEILTTNIILAVGEGHWRDQKPLGNWGKAIVGGAGDGHNCAPGMGKHADRLIASDCRAKFREQFERCFASGALLGRGAFSTAWLVKEYHRSALGELADGRLEIPVIEAGSAMDHEDFRTIPGDADEGRANRRFNESLVRSSHG